MYGHVIIRRADDRRAAVGPHSAQPLTESSRESYGQDEQFGSDRNSQANQTATSQEPGRCISQRPVVAGLRLPLMDMAAAGARTAHRLSKTGEPRREVTDPEIAGPRQRRSRLSGPAGRHADHGVIQAVTSQMFDVTTMVYRDLAGTSLWFNLGDGSLSRERLAAAARPLGLGVVDGEAASLEPVAVVEGCSAEV